MNQILISEKVYITPELKRKKRMYKIDFFISVFLVFILSSYYIYAEYDKSKNEAGWIFMDYKNSKDLTDDNTVIYAHNRIDNSMFGSLNKLLKKDLNKEFALIFISNENIKNTYQIFSVYIVDEEDYYIQTKFKNLEDKDSWLKTIKERDTKSITIKPNNEDKILTLSTCYGKNQRLVVHAKLL